MELYFTTPMTTAQVVEHLGYPTRQCLERWLAMDSRYAGHMAKPIIPLETRRRAVGPVPGGMQQKQASKQLGAGVGAVHGWVRAYRKGGMAALQPKNRNSAQGNKPADSRRRPSAADDDDAEALRRRVEEPEPGNALMREVVEARRKRPRRRPAAPVEQGEDPVDRPVGAGVFARLDDMLARHRAQRPPTAATPGSALASTPDSGQRWPGVRRFQGQVRVPQDQGGAQDRRIGEGGPQDHGGGRARGARAQATQVWFLRGRDDAGSRQSRRPGLHGRASEREVADGHHPGSRPGTGRACLSPPVDCFDGKIVAYTAGFSPNAELANRMPEKAASTLPGNARPLVHSDRGCHCRWPGWLGLMERFGLTRSMSARGCSPDNAAAEGFFGRMKTEAVHPEKWEEHTRNEVLALVDEYIRWHDHERIKQSLGWMSPVQYRQSQGMAA